MAEGYKDWAAGDILTAADLEDYTVKQSVMIFDDSSARTTALTAVLREGMVSYLKDTNAIEVYDGSAWVSVGGATMIKKVAAFTASGSWTVPTGVTYAIAHIRGGGGGIKLGRGTSNAGNGGTSSVAFASGTISAAGGGKGLSPGDISLSSNASAGPANSGLGAVGATGDASLSGAGQGQNGSYIVAGADVTPAASITVTVGAGGSAGTSGAAGGSGYVWIEYYEEA